MERITIKQKVRESAVYINTYETVITVIASNKERSMRFGSCLMFVKQLGLATSVKKMANVGFKYVDFNLTKVEEMSFCEEDKHFKGILNILNGEGVQVSQTHAPFDNSPWTDASDAFFKSKDFREKIRADIRRTAILESPYLVVHPFVPHAVDYDHVVPNYNDFIEDNIKRSIDVFGSFKSISKSRGILWRILNDKRKCKGLLKKKS